MGSDEIFLSGNDGDGGHGTVVRRYVERTQAREEPYTNAAGYCEVQGVKKMETTWEAHEGIRVPQT